MDPLRSEADAFRLLLIVGAGALTVIAIALLFGSLPGFIWGLVLIGAGLGRVLRGRRNPPTGADVAVVVDDVPGDELIAELQAVDGEPEILLAMVIAPGSPGADRERALGRMEVSVRLMQEAGLRTRGRVLEAAAEDLRGGGPVPGLEAERTVVALGGGEAGGLGGIA